MTENNYQLKQTSHGVYHVTLLNLDTIIGEIQPCNDHGILFYRSVYVTGHGPIISDIWPTVMEAMTHIVTLYED